MFYFVYFDCFDKGNILSWIAKSYEPVGLIQHKTITLISTSKMQLLIKIWDLIAVIKKVVTKCWKIKSHLNFKMMLYFYETEPRDHIVEKVIVSWKFRKTQWVLKVEIGKFKIMKHARVTKKRRPWNKIITGF